MDWQLTGIDDYPGKLWDSWDALNERYHRGHPLLDSRFVAPLTAFFGDRVRVLAGGQNGATDALMLLDRPTPLVQSSFQPSQAPLALALLPTALTAVDQPSKWPLGAAAWRLDWYSVDPWFQPALLQLERCSVATKLTNITIDLDGSFDSYWTSRSRGLRKHLNGYRRKFAADCGDYTLQVHREPGDMALAVARYGMLESRGWKGRAGTSLHPGNDQGQFYAQVLAAFAASGQAMAIELWLGERLLASRLCLLGGGLMTTVKTTFDEDFRPYAIGRVHLQDTIELAFAEPGIAVLDFYTNASSDQLAWATDSRPIHTASAYRGLPGRLLAAVDRLRAGPDNDGPAA